ncbi:MAG: tetratricopeptide repeat protein [Pseudomonadota bacterium]
METNAKGADSGPADEGSTGKAGWFLLGGAALLAAGSIGYNSYEGQSEPMVAQAATEAEPTIEALREAAEASDDDARPWSNLAFAHYNRNEFSAAVEAYERAIEIDGNAAELWSALGEARVMAVDAQDPAADPLPGIAIDAFEQALELDPSDPRARYFMGVKRDIDGDHEGAISDWLALLADTPPGAPWERDVVRTIQQVGAIQDIEVEERIAIVIGARAPQVAIPGSGTVAGEAASPNVRGPSAAQVAEARNMSQGEQEAMIAGMVESLEARLDQDPGNLDGWVMLMRSRMTLGETGKARQALEDAVAANPQYAPQLRAQALELGIE